MNIHAAYPTTPDEFLRWNEGREGKWEFAEGKVADMMVRVSRAHAILCTRICALLARSLAFPPYTISTADFGVRTATSIRYPDVMVDADGTAAGDLSAMSPILIGEVLSPSTLAVDLNLKATEYQSIESLQHYLVLAQDEPRAWLWSRTDDGGWSAPEMIAEPTGVIRLTPPLPSLPLADLYQGLTDRA